MSLSLKDIKNALENLVTLDIRTVVGDFSYDQHGKLLPGPGAKQIVSRINLLDGDITTAFSEDFLVSPLDLVRGYHNVRERQGMDIVQGNIKALQQLASLIVSLNQEEKRQTMEITTEASPLENTEQPPLSTPSLAARQRVIGLG